MSAKQMSAGLVLAIAILGCARTSPPVPLRADIPTTSAIATPTPTPAVKKRVSDRPADDKDGVLVTMYHNFAEKPAAYTRTFAQFRKDLERLYRLGFRPVTTREYIENKMDLPSGASPVVMTFDDADPSQFLLKPDGTVDPDCAVGIWLDFGKTHPDFPLKATFYVLPKLWGVREERQKKIDMLKGWGSEIGCHTWTHPQLDKLKDKIVEWELSKSLDFLASYGVTECSLAYPYGLKPKNPKLLKGFDYKGRHYSVTAGLLADTNLAKSPLDKRFNRYEIPRIEGNDSLDYWLERFEHGRKVYVAP